VILSITKMNDVVADLRRYIMKPCSRYRATYRFFPICQKHHIINPNMSSNPYLSIADF